MPDNESSNYEEKSATIGPFILGILIWALVVNFLRGGTPQAKGWLAAKFFNQPYTGGKN